MRLVGARMEVWIRLEAVDETPVMEGADRLIGPGPASGTLWLENGTVQSQEGAVGAHLHINDGATQNDGRALMGSVEWLWVECQTWSMIPLENLIAARAGSPTKIAATITSPTQAQGAGFALEQGVDALVVANRRDLVEAALSVQAQRGEERSFGTAPAASTTSLSLTELRIKSVDEAGVGDRYCLDFLSLFTEGEGVLIGSSASTMALVHSETIPSTFVPTRPFRVNAGSPHAYIMMADGSTNYLSELTSGDAILAVKHTGATRTVVLGRLKIEQRPMLKVSFQPKAHNERKPKEAHVYMQQAETVRLMDRDARPCSVTELKPEDVVMGWTGHGGRHLGQSIGSRLEER